MFFEKIHIQYSVRLQPTLRGFRRQGPNEPQATGPIRKDRLCSRPSIDFFNVVVTFRPFYFSGYLPQRILLASGSLRVR